MATYDAQHRGGGDAYASYFAAMDAAMQQKVALTTAHMPAAGRIADMGSGSGRGTWDLACLHPGLEVVGVDINPVSVAAAQAAYRRPNLSYRVGDIADRIFAPGSLDAVLDSSVLHHVTSFTGFSTARLEEGIDHQVEALRVGGVLVIRDFVAPEDGEAEVVLELPAHDGAESGEPAALSTAALFTRFAAAFRSSRNRDGAVPSRELAPARDGWRRFALARRAAAEFLLRKDYRADWEVELREEYTWWTLAETVRALEHRRLRVVAAMPIRNPWIVANRWRGRARLSTPAGEPLSFPPTNMLVVGERVAPRVAVRLVESEARSLAGPGFVQVHAWRHASTGATLELAERPGRTIDLLPWWREGDRVLVLARRGVARPIANAGGGGSVDGASRSGHITEPVAAIVEREPDAEAALAVLATRAGVAREAVAAVGAPWRYLTSPGGIDERVAAFPVELRAEPALAAIADGELRALDARQVLRACHVGGMFDARLELGCQRLLRRLRLDPGPWIGAALPAAAAISGAVGEAGALAPPASAPFTRVDLPAAGFLEARRGTFAALDADGAEVATLTRDYVRPRTRSDLTVTALPYARLPDGRIAVGLEWRELPAAQLATGSAALVTVPAWRVPRGIGSADEMAAFAAARLQAEFAAEAPAPVELGGPYLSTPGVTPEQVQPYAAPARAAGGLRWVALADALAAADALADAHLAIALHRLAHALLPTAV